MSGRCGRRCGRSWDGDAERGGNCAESAQIPLVLSFHRRQCHCASPARSGCPLQVPPPVLHPSRSLRRRILSACSLFTGASDTCKPSPVRLSASSAPPPVLHPSRSLRRRILSAMARRRCVVTPRWVGAPLPAGCHLCRGFAPSLLAPPARIPARIHLPLLPTQPVHCANFCHNAGPRRDL